MVFVNLSYVFTRERRDFGRCCRFKVEGPMFMYNEPPNAVLRATHIRKKPRAYGTQIDKHWGFHEVNTDMVPYKKRGENHVEGGWPKDVNILDTTMTARYAKKMERDDVVIQLLPQLYNRSYRWLIQNSSLDIFDELKGDTAGRSVTGQPSCRKRNIYHDVSGLKRPCVSISFCYDNHKFAAAYNDRIFQNNKPTDNMAYIWHLEEPNEVDMALAASFAVTVLTYSPRDSWSLAGGLLSGQICYWDTRRGSLPVRTTPFYDSFRMPASCIKWVNTKDGMNVFASSFDGSVMWWDLRYLDEPVDYLIVDNDKTSSVLSIANSWGITALEYEPTISTKFMMGTENGFVISGNRKGRTMQEKLQTVYNCGIGPVNTVERNPYYLKNFLTVNDFTAKIWSEDFKEQAIMWSKPGSTRLVAGGWSPHRHSCFFLAREDGCVEAWDLVDMTDKPVITFKASDHRLECMAIHENGTYIATGSSKGEVILLEMSQHFNVTDRASKTVLGNMFDRESRREKLLEGKLREQRLKARGGMAEAEPECVYDESAIQRSENYFTSAIKQFELTGKIVRTKNVVAD